MSADTYLPSCIQALTGLELPPWAGSLAGLEASIREAVTAGDQASLPRLVMAHAGEIERLAHTSPLTVLETGSVDDAVWVAAVADPDQVVARLLLLAWHSMDRGQDDALHRAVSALSALQVSPGLPRPIAVPPAAIGQLLDRQPALSPWFAERPSVSGRSYEVWGSEAAFKGLVDQAVGVGRLDQAATSITRERFGQDVPERWLEVVEALVAASQPGLAQAAVERLRASIDTLHASRWIRAQYWPVLARAQALTGDLDGAIATGGDEAGAPHGQETWEAVVAALVERGDAAAALRLARSVGSLAGRYGALVRIAGAQATAGDNEGARATVAEAQALVVDPVWMSTPIAGRMLVAWQQDVPGPERGGTARVAHVAAQDGDEDAVRLAMAIRDAALRARTLAQVAENQAHAGDVTTAWATRNLACDAAGTVGPGVKGQVRSRIVRAQAAIARQALRQGGPEAATLVLATSCDREAATTLAGMLED